MSTQGAIHARLSQLKPYLRERFHVSSIGLFGSVVRDDFSSASDVDIVVDFNKPIGIEFVDLAEELEKLLKRKVDLVSRRGIKPAYLQAIQHEIVYV